MKQVFGLLLLNKNFLALVILITLFTEVSYSYARVDCSRGVKQLMKQIQDLPNVHFFPTRAVSEGDIRNCIHCKSPN